MNPETLHALFQRYGVHTIGRHAGDCTVSDFLKMVELDGVPLEPTLMPLPFSPGDRARETETVLDVVVDQGAALRDSLERVRLELLEHRQDVEELGLVLAASILYAAQAQEERDPQTAIQNAVAFRQELRREVMARRP